MSRQTDIADAAIATLARDGMRGLTHRAVERQPGPRSGPVGHLRAGQLRTAVAA
jgi:hypothetical protein